MMCKKLIFLISLILPLTLVLVGTANADTWHVADSDVAVSGTVSGTYGSTTHSNDVYQSITEVTDGTTSYLEHKWTLDVTGGASVVIYIEAHHTSNGEGDDFVFAYGVNDVNYVDFLTVTKTSDDDSIEHVMVSEATSGTVYVRVRDADRTNGNTSLDTIYIDNIFIGCLSTTWWNGSETHMWDEPNNWWGAVPQEGRFTYSNTTGYENHCLIDSTVTALCGNLCLAKAIYGDGEVYLVMTGGTLACDANIEIGCTKQYDYAGVRDTGVFFISGGTASTGLDVYVGNQGDACIDMSGGKIDVNQCLYVPKTTDGNGLINLCYATIEAGSISMNSHGLIDFEKGVLVIDGNVVSQVEGYITNGWITAYGGEGSVYAFYDTAAYPGQTMVFSQIAKSWNPSPDDGAEDVNRLTTLSWTKGDWDDTHEIYLGTSYSDVDNATTSSDEYIGSQGADSNSYDPGGLDIGKTYYWRVDEVNSGEPWGSPWKGTVWQFTTDHLVIEDFESYADDSDLVATWIDGTDANNPSSSTIFLGVEFFERHDGNTMVFDFDNSASPYYSEVYRSYAAAQDWSIGDAKKLVLFFRGTEDCNITEQMYVALEDADNTAVVTYDGDANDLMQVDGEYWHVWNIDLQDFNDANNVNEKAIEKIIIGFGDRLNPSAGNAGTVYFDDIGLYAHTCPADGTEYLADADFDINEAVCFKDFRELAVAWMSSDGEPNFGDIYDLDSNDSVTTCDLGLFSDDWLWPDNEVAITINAGSVDGNISTGLLGMNLSYTNSTDDIYADANVIDYLKDAGISTLRYPGGMESSYYHWEYPYMPLATDAWDPAVDPNDYISNTQHMDTNEAAELAQELGAELVFVVNFDSSREYAGKTIQDSVNDAVNWLQHCVNNNLTVDYWIIENEPHYGSHSFGGYGCIDVEDYADYVNQFATAMKAVDPNVKIGVNWYSWLDEPNYWDQWEYLIETTGPNVSYADLHWYWRDYDPASSWALWLSENPMKLREWCPHCYDDYDANSARYEGPAYYQEVIDFHNNVSDVNGQSYDIKLIVMEWNVGRTLAFLYSRCKYALMQAETIGQFIKGGLHMATIWPGDWNYNLGWNARTVLDQENKEPTPSFLVFKLYKEALGQQLITSSSGNDHIFVVSALSQDGNTLWSYLVNKTADAITAQFDISSFTTASAEAVAITANDNDMESDEANLRELEIDLNSGTGDWECVLPPFSLTRVTLNQ